MAGAATGAKRARAAAFSAHEKYMHKSGVVLQREGKKIRAFLVRKAVAQLKQTRDQHATASAAVDAGGDLDEKKLKRLQGKAKKLFHQVDKHEKELAALKTLDLKAVVARAFEKTGLKVDEPAEESDDDTAVRAPMSAHEREMAKYGRGRVVVENDRPSKARAEEREEAEERMIDDEDDDGFNSEDYDEVPRSEASDSENSGEEEEGSSEDEEESENEEDGSEDEKMEGEDEDEELQIVEAEEITEGALLFGPMGPPGDSQPASKAEDAGETAAADPAMIDQLIERVLSHNQMQPFLDAIRQYVEKKERDEAKKRRQKEKSALKRARASMVGGRSSAAPKSMFFGSLSGDAPDDDEDDPSLGFGRASMAGAEDDIADFLGETKKKKNRPGQMARRQKAIRMEEARRNEEEGADGFQKRRFNTRDAPAVGKYGPSERPKKQQKKDGPRGAKPKSDGDRSSWKDKDSTNTSTRGGSRDFKKPSVEDKRQERRARAEAAPKARPSAPQRKPEAEPSHPSWLAKQALKEKMKVDINAFSGKKITFGDD